MRLPDLIDSPDAEYEPATVEPVVGEKEEEDVVDELYGQLMAVLTGVWRKVEGLADRADPSSYVFLLVILVSLTLLMVLAWLCRSRWRTILLQRRWDLWQHRHDLWQLRRDLWSRTRRCPTTPPSTPVRPATPGQQRANEETRESPDPGRYLTPVRSSGARGRRLFESTSPSSPAHIYEDMSSRNLGEVQCPVNTESVRIILSSDLQRVLSSFNGQFVRLLGRQQNLHLPLTADGAGEEEEDQSSECGAGVGAQENQPRMDGRQGEELEATKEQGGSSEVSGESEQGSFPPLRRWSRVCDAEVSLLLRDEIKEEVIEPTVSAESLQVPAEDVIQEPKSGEVEDSRRGRSRGGRRGGQRRRGRAQGSSPGVGGEIKELRSGRRYRRT